MMSTAKIPMILGFACCIFAAWHLITRTTTYQIAVAFNEGQTIIANADLNERGYVGVSYKGSLITDNHIAQSLIAEDKDLNPYPCNGEATNLITGTVQKADCDAYNKLIGTRP